MRSHIGPNGPGKCTATEGKCPFGGESGTENHFDSIADARHAFESQMASETLNGKITRAGVSEQTDLPKVAIGNEIIARRALLSAGLSGAKMDSAMKILKEGKGSDKVLDQLLEDMEFAGISDPYHTDAEELQKGKEFKDALIAIRTKSGTSTTMSSVASFDPSKETVFSNKLARKNPTIARDAINKGVKHSEWLAELADKADADSENMANYGEIEAAQNYKNLSAQYVSGLQKSEANIDAQMKEMAWLYANDADFKREIDSRSGGYLLTGTNLSVSPAKDDAVKIRTPKKIKA